MRATSIDDLQSPMGLVAGNSQFPLEIAQQAAAHAISVVAVAHIGETDPDIEKFVSKCLWLHIGQLGKIIKFLSKNGVKQAVMAGGISRVKLFGSARPDFKALALASRLGTLRDDVILRGIADEIEKAGIEIISPALLLERSVPRKGLLTTRDLTAQEREDAAFGWTVAKQTGALDIGQTVAVLEGLVVALEAIEGTDATILRAGELSIRAREKKSLKRLITGHVPGPVIVKLCKPQQDLRLDLPTIGVRTIESMIAAGATALVIEAGKTIMLDPEGIVRLANSNRIAIRVEESREELLGSRT